MVQVYIHQADAVGRREMTQTNWSHKLQVCADGCDNYIYNYASFISTATTAIIGIGVASGLSIRLLMGCGPGRSGIMNNST